MVDELINFVGWLAMNEITEYNCDIICGLVFVACLCCSVGSYSVSATVVDKTNAA